jgi:acylphosphatase
MVRYTVHFSGHVQGVGFRYTARDIAGNHDLAGYVQNLHDGRVLLVIEGEAEHLEAYLESLTRQMGRFVGSRTLDRSPATGEFGLPGIDGLEIRR